MLDAARGYLQLATGLTETTMRKALEVAQSLLAGDLEDVVPSKDAATGAARVVGSQVQDLADDLVAQASANRELLVGLIRTEVDRAAGRLGFVREEELAAVRRHVQRLEAQLDEIRAEMRTLVGPGGSAPSPSTDAAPIPARPVKRPVKKKVPVRPVTPAKDAGTTATEPA